MGRPFGRSGWSDDGSSDVKLIKVQAQCCRMELNGIKALDIIGQLKVVSFNWNETGEEDLGLIAEEVEKVFPVAVYKENGVVTGLKVSPLIALCIKAIQELKE